MAQAQSLIAVGRNAEAIQLLRSAVSSDPHDPDLLCWLGFALQRDGKPAEALRAGQSAAALAPETEWPHRLMADALIDLGKNKQALAAAQEAMRLDPMNPSVLHIVAEAQLASGKTSDADATASRLIELEPESPAGFDLRGRAALKRKRFVEAEAHFKEALRLDSDNWRLNNNLGVALQGQKKRKEAVEAFERAVKANPSVNLARKNLYGATRRYVRFGGSILVVYLLVRAIPVVGNAAHLPTPLVALMFVVIVGGAIAGFWWFGRRRRRQLSPSVDLFYQRELGLERKVNFLHAVFRVGPLIAIAVGLLAMGAAQVPEIGLWIVIGMIVIVAWFVLAPFLWRRALLPRLRPYDQGL